MDVSGEEHNLLSEDEIEENWRLACAYMVHNDIDVEL